MDGSWQDAETFLAVAEARSFSAAARVLGIGQPTISRRIATLESRLGCQLFSRGKQGATLTEAGDRLLPAAEQMARWAGEFGRIAQGTEATPSGIVRITAPPGLAAEVLAPFAATVREHYPDIRLEIQASVDYLDLARGGADLAIRTRPTTEPELATLHTTRFELGVYASADYVDRLRSRLQEHLQERRRARPPDLGADRPANSQHRDASRSASSHPSTTSTTSDSAGLDDLDWITWCFPYEEVAPRPMLERAIPDFEPAFASDNYLVLKSALVAGMGAMVLQKREAERQAGDRLVEIDLGFSLPATEFHLICAKSMRAVPRVRAVADLLVAEVERDLDGEGHKIRRDRSHGGAGLAEPDRARFHLASADYKP